MRMPLWVRLWIVIGLGGVNLYAFFMLHTDVGKWTALAAVFVLCVNTPTLIYQRGWGKALAIAHLFVWPALIIYIGCKLLSPDTIFAPKEYSYALLVLIVNSISVVFDIFDTREFIKGNRAVA